MTTPRVRAAYMEEADDESGQVLHETKVSASVGGETVRSREKANSKKSRQSPSPANLTDSDSTTIMSPRSRREKDVKTTKGKDKDRTSERERRERERDRDRDRDRDDKNKRTSRGTTVTFKERPSPKHSKTSPVLHHSSRKSDESEYYGVSGSQQTAFTGRPGRSMSYHASGGGKPYHPPQANAHFYMAQGAMNNNNYYPQPPYAPPMYAGASYPAPHGPIPDLASLEEAQQRNLKQRFETGPRSASAMGQRPSSKSIFEREQEDDGMRRRPSLKKRESDRDRDRMPPPPRPKTTRPEKIALRPAPPQVHRTRAYEDEDLLAADPALYQDVAARRVSGDYGGMYPAPRRPSILYVDTPTMHLQPAVTHRPPSRPHSFYGQQGFDYMYGPGPGPVPGGFGGPESWEDKMREAEHYQHTATSGAQPLTKDALKRASRKGHGGGSSRSTRSTESRDESDYRRSSNATRTTRSTVPGDEDLTITVPANTTLEVQGTKIQCRDGGEVNISSARVGGSRSSGSDKESIYEERPTRSERPSFRGRAMSQSSSYSRTRPMMDPYFPNPYLPQPRNFI